MALCTETLGCPWRCNFHYRRQKAWRCHRCNRTEDEKHNWYCESQRDVHVFRCRSRSRSRPPTPRRHDVDQRPSHGVSWNLCYHRTILTCGRMAAVGKLLRRANPRLKGPRICYDVADALYDPFRPANSPDETHVETQRRLSRLEGFRYVHTGILSTLLRERYTVVICSHGVHRSVGVVEMAAQDIRSLFALVIWKYK